MKPTYKARTEPVEGKRLFKKKKTSPIAGAAVAFGQSSSSTDKADALAEAARKGDAAAVKKLLDEGVDVNTKFRYGATALSYACDRGHLDVVKLLIDRGADVNVKDTFYDATPLTWAVSPAMGRKPQHPEIVRLLLQHGAQGKGQALLGAVSEPDAGDDEGDPRLGRPVTRHALSDALDVGDERQTRGHRRAARAGRREAARRVQDRRGAARAIRRHLSRAWRDAELVLTVADGRLTGGVQRPAPHASSPVTDDLRRRRSAGRDR